MKKLQWVIVICALLIVTGLVWRPTVTASEDQKVKEVYDSLQQRNYEEAIRRWEELLFYKPDDLTILAGLVQMHFNAGNYAGAKKFGEQLIQYHGDSEHLLVIKTYDYLGQISLAEKNVSTAREYFQKAIELKEDYAEAYAGLALCYTDEQRIKTYLRGIEQDPWHEVNYLGLLDYYLENGVQINNYQELGKFLPLDKANSLVLAQIGHHLYEKSDLRMAVIVHKQALAKNETISLSYRDLGQIYQEQGLLQQAIENYEKALLFEKYPINFVLLAEAYFELEQYEKVVETLLDNVYYQGIVNMGDEYLLALAYHRLGKDDRALYWLDYYELDTDQANRLRAEITE